MTREQAEPVLRAALKMVGEGFLEGLKSDTYRAALESVENIDGMSDEDFSTLLAQRICILDPEERKEAERSIARQIERWTGDEDAPLSLREEILLNLQGLIKSHEYRAEKN